MVSNTPPISNTNPKPTVFHNLLSLNSTLTMNEPKVTQSLATLVRQNEQYYSII